MRNQREEAGLNSNLSGMNGFENQLKDEKNSTIQGLQLVEMVNSSNL